jgi:Bacterial regulatory proteins, tetR family
VSRSAEYTRGSIIKAAVHLFAEKGFQGASVRDIVVKARVNQAPSIIISKARMGYTSKFSKLRSRS